MWVFCCGMYRSASTLQFQVTSRLVEQAQAGEVIGWIDADRFEELLPQARSHYQIIKVHRCTPAIVDAFKQGNAIGVYTFRDIRDVYASMMKQRQKTFEFLWEAEFIQECLDNYDRWAGLPQVLISNYQDLLCQLPQETEKIAQHLQLNLPPATCHAIAAAHSIEAQQQRITQFRQALLTQPIDPNDHRELVDYHDEATLLHINHIDAVKTGRWQTDLSQSEVQQIEAELDRWCKAHGYHPQQFLQGMA